MYEAFFMVGSASNHSLIPRPVVVAWVQGYSHRGTSLLCNSFSTRPTLILGT